MSGEGLSPQGSPGMDDSRTVHSFTDRVQSPGRMPTGLALCSPTELVLAPQPEVGQSPALALENREPWCHKPYSKNGFIRTRAIRTQASRRRFAKNAV